ncbi:MAG: DMT family transporter [Ammonifex sp.]|jgi:transporter family-2 protein|nr:MAG: DMT family transporter [Ammonifex sp.]
MFGLCFLSLILAAAAGSLMAVQGSVNALLGKISGLWEATFIVHAVGVVFAGTLLIFLGSGGFTRLGNVPWYAWTGGLLGVLIIFGVAKSIPKVGVAPATTAIVFAQVLTATVIDHFGLFGMARLPFTGWRIVGGLLLTAGVWFLMKR